MDNIGRMFAFPAYSRNWSNKWRKPYLHRFYSHISSGGLPQTCVRYQKGIEDSLCARVIASNVSTTIFSLEYVYPSYRAVACFYQATATLLMPTIILSIGWATYLWIKSPITIDMPIMANKIVIITSKRRREIVRLTSSSEKSVLTRPRI